MNVDTNVPVGDFGSVELKISGGVASESFTANKSFLNGAIKVKVTEEVDADLIAALELIKLAVEKALPAGKTIEDFAFAEIESILKA